ncbi:MAG: nucleotidyltransferase domain-containing protein [Ignavibacteriales bacterium]|nr:nucleotidyltransferase domain-containing protein [Ignavibacteriales bacterium]
MKRNNHISMKEIQAIAKRIAEKYNVQKVILFGSYAQGNADENSDVDLLVVMNMKKRPIEQRYEIYKSLTPIHFALDIIVRTEEDVKQRIPQGDWFLKEAYDLQITHTDSLRFRYYCQNRG